MKCYIKFIMNELSNTDIQEQQGFIPTKLQLKQKHSHYQAPSTADNARKEFTATYLTGSVPLKLEPSEVLASCKEVEDSQNNQQKDMSNQQAESKHNQNTAQSKDNKINQPLLRDSSTYRKQKQNSLILDHPFNIYIENSQSYSLIYSKNNSDRPIVNEFQYISRAIMLETNEGGLNKSQKSNKKYLHKTLKPYQSGNHYKQSNQVQKGQNNKQQKLVNAMSFPKQKYKQATKVQTKNLTNKLLQFDSKFQCGNLHCVYHKINTQQYHLFIENDTNTYGYNQWFYFLVKNIQPHTKYTFRFVNLKKKHSFFKYGYKPAVFQKYTYTMKNDERNPENESQEWLRLGQNISYTDSSLSVSKFFKFYCLSFDLKFGSEKQPLKTPEYALIAANLPYSYTRLSKRLLTFSKNMQQNSQQYGTKVKCSIKTLCKTFCGNDLPQIKLTPLAPTKTKPSTSSSISPTKDLLKNSQKSKQKMIVFMARQHPGQTVSSYMMDGILSVLENKSNNKQIKYLLENFTILIYPMINIDGVIYGNFRCDITGMDLNRRWSSPSQLFHPQIYHIKQKILKYSHSKRYQIVSCIDLHGHSKLYNVFAYSCKINPITCRILPYIISKQIKHQKFFFPNCTFKLSRYKQTTARSNIFKIIKNENVLTIETSYYGYRQKLNASPDNNAMTSFNNNNKVSIKYFQLRDFYEVSYGILTGLKKFLQKEKKQYKQVQAEIQLNLSQILSYDNSQLSQKQDSGSQSDPEGDQIQLQIKLRTIIPKQFVEQASQSFIIKEIVEEKQVDLTIDLLSKNIPIKISSQAQTNINNDQSPSKKKQIRIKKQKNQYSRTIQKSVNISISKQRMRKLPQKQITKTISIKRKERQKLITPQKKPSKTFDHSNNNLSKRTYLSDYPHQKKRSITKQPKNFSNLKQKRHSQQYYKNANTINPKPYDDIFVYSKSNEITADQNTVRIQSPTKQKPSQQFFIKFQKFIPSAMHPKNKQKLNNLEQSIYKDDQSQLLSTLLANKKKLEKQKIKREVQRSTNIVERQGKIRALTSKKESNSNNIVDFRKFKDQEKFKIQLRQANQTYNRYMEPYF